jgi:hypothetical protein
MNGLIWFGTALFLVGIVIGSADVAMIALGMTGIVVIVEDIIHQRKSK